MKGNFFLIFQKLNSLPPKLYKTLKSVQKYKMLNSKYQVKQYTDQIIAQTAFKIKQIQFKKHQNQSKQSKKQSKRLQKQSNQEQTLLKRLNQNQLIEKNTQQNGQKTDQIPQISQQNQKNHENPKNLLISKRKIRTVGSIAKKYIKKTVQQLQIEKQKLMDLTPEMPKFMQYHTPLPSLHQIFSNEVYNGFYDGCTKRNPGPSGAGYFIKKDTIVYLQGAYPLGTKTNNQAQFLAFLYLMVDAYINGIRRINIYGDNKLSICVAKGEMIPSSVSIIDYGEACRKMTTKFQFIKLEHINRTYNSHADRLANIGVKKKAVKNPEFSVY